MRAWRLIRRDLALAWSSGAVLALAFFLAVGVMTPFAVGPDPQMLGRIAGGSVWVAFLLAALLGLERLLQPDVEDGTLEQWAAAGLSLTEVAYAKLCVHMLGHLLPLLAGAPLLAVLLNLPLAQLPTLLLSLAVGGAGLSALGVAAAALSVGVARGGLLISLLVLPLAAPLVIFGVGALDAQAGGAAFKLLAATSLFFAAVGPYAAAAGLRLALD